MNFLQKIESFFGWAQPSTPKPAPGTSPFQAGVNTAGQLVDELEVLFDKFTPLGAVLPAPFSVYLGTLGLAIHGIDGYVDTLETQPVAPPTPVPAPAPTPAPSAPTPPSAPPNPA